MGQVVPEDKGLIMLIKQNLECNADTTDVSLEEAQNVYDKYRDFYPFSRVFGYFYLLLTGYILLVMLYK